MSLFFQRCLPGLLGGLSVGCVFSVEGGGRGDLFSRFRAETLRRHVEAVENDRESILLTARNIPAFPSRPDQQ